MNGMFKQQDTSFESICGVAGSRLAVYKTTATLKGALGPQINNSVSLIILQHIYSLEISDLKINCCGWGEVASSQILSGPKYSSDLVFQKNSHWCTGVASKVLGLFWQVRKQKLRESSFPRWVAQRSGRGAEIPLAPRCTDVLVFTPSCHLSSQCCNKTP